MSDAARRPFPFACRVSGGRGRIAAEWVALALRAESVGSTFAVAEHVATYYAPIPLLQLVAAHTSRIRLATLVLDNDFRHTAMLAKEAAGLDVLSAAIAWFRRHCGPHCELRLGPDLRSDVVAR